MAQAPAATLEWRPSRLPAEIAGDNNPIRTLLMVGERADWQRDNFICWSMRRQQTERLLATRSMSTSGAGVYNGFWDGVDDAGNVMAAGTYVLHVETSRERGQHTYRSLTRDFSKATRTQIHA